MTQLDQKVSNDLVKELKDISPPLADSHSPPLADSQGDILVEEVQKAVKKLKNNKSSGNDGITGEMIKHGGPHLIEEIHQLCNKAWKTAIAPTEWKKSVLVLLHKKGSAMECSNYRTIALTSHLGKSANDNPNRKTEITERRTHGGRTSRISQRQEYSTKDSSP